MFTSPLSTPEKNVPGFFFICLDSCELCMERLGQEEKQGKDKA